MEWPGFIALVGLLLVVRLLVFQRWRSYRLSHRQAATLYASVIPLMLIAGFAFLGIGSLGQLLFDVGLALFVFGSTFVLAEFFLRAFGGEMDPPASHGYRRRP
ncbi:MAG: hypothetical protein E6J35_11070 [Chloroflexi bacterium]|nr:MAG: hypothetical protein E6J35_11070 [Chloroflexota bacterium]